MNALLDSTPLPNLPAWSTVLVLAPALAAAGTSLVIRRTSVATSWRLARASTGLIALASAAIAAVRIATGPHANGLVRVDNVTVSVLLLISLIGAVVVRYSSVYLRGDVYEHRYVRRLLATLAAVSTVVVANHLLLLIAAWAAASVALHGLLTFFGDRPVAVAVAHKKFLLARSADACMIGAAVAFGATFSTLRIDAIVGRAVAVPAMPFGARLGILLVAVAAVLKCAQLPFHGWLIQVMEAPTPVSALLHAGVVNLGGVVLLRFAPVVDRAVETRALLVVVGVVTAVVAALVMTTRVSVKVALAWSTCAQMGFMLMQCGLGIWEMALLHLLAHSVYKAHTFLAAGGTVRQTQRRQLAVPTPAPGLSSVVVGAAVAVAGTGAVGALWALVPGSTPLTATAWVLLGIVALALVPLTTPFRSRGHRSLLARALLVPIAYVVLHELIGRLVPHARTTPVVLLVFTAAGFAALFVVQAACLVAPCGRLARRLRPWIYAGLFLDETFTRLAFKISPP
ncbi:MAG: NADH-quinone oxidoreductase subunit L, partial [Ilumatobacteraceae bacterium]